MAELDSPVGGWRYSPEEQVIASLRYLKDRENKGKLTRDERMQIISMLFPTALIEEIRNGYSQSRTSVD